MTKRSKEILENLTEQHARKAKAIELRQQKAEIDQQLKVNAIAWHQLESEYQVMITEYEVHLSLCTSDPGIAANIVDDQEIEEAVRNEPQERTEMPPPSQPSTQNTRSVLVPSASEPETSPALSPIPAKGSHVSQPMAMTEAPDLSDSMEPRLDPCGNRRVSSFKPRSIKPSVNEGSSTTNSGSCSPTHNLATQTSEATNPSRAGRKSNISWPSTSIPPSGPQAPIPPNFDMFDMIQKADASEKRAKELRNPATNRPPVAIADDYQGEAAQRHVARHGTGDQMAELHAKASNWQNKERRRLQAKEYEAAKKKE